MALGICRDLVDLGKVFLHRGFQGRLKMGNLDLIQGRKPRRNFRPFLHERVGGSGTLLRLQQPARRSGVLKFIGQLP